MPQVETSPLFALVILLILPPVMAIVLKSARTPGWAVLGGLLAGVLLGPTIFGRLMPQRFETIFIGGTLQRQGLEDLAHRHQRDLAVARQAGANENAFLFRESVYQRERAELDVSQAEARWEHQTPLRWYMAVVIALTLLGSASVHVRDRDRRQGFIAPISIGLWSALLPGALTFMAARWWWDLSFEESLLFGSALAIGPWALGPIDREAADNAEFGGAHMIQNAGRVASLIALPVLGWSLWKIDGDKLVWLAPMLAHPISWLLPKFGSVFVKRTLEHVLFPLLAALVMIRVDLILHARIGMIIVIMLLAGDGRWLGAFCGAMAPGGRRSLRTMRLILGTMSCGPTMLAVAGIGVATGALGESPTLALALGVGLIEATTPMRRLMARRLAETDEEIEEIKGQM